MESVESRLVDRACDAARRAWYWRRPPSWSAHVARLEKELFWTLGEVQ